MRARTFAAALIYALFATLSPAAAELPEDLSTEIRSLASRVSREAQTLEARAEAAQAAKRRAEERALRRLVGLDDAAAALLAGLDESPGDLATIDADLSALRSAYARALTAVDKLENDPLEIEAAFDRLASAYYALEETVAFAAAEIAAPPPVVWLAPRIAP